MLFICTYFKNLGQYFFSVLIFFLRFALKKITLAENEEFKNKQLREANTLLNLRSSDYIIKCYDAFYGVIAPKCCLNKLPEPSELCLVLELCVSIFFFKLEFKTYNLS